ncbi:MAG TPA: TetR/AcrR family transcriptional regulator [Acidimicrobiales bacterium]|nr:TetR/AcrR family transcriptional regulator [Acidimicrobiales bacterium]
MSNGGAGVADWKEGRRRSARTAIVGAAWAAVREEGLAALNMRHLAARAGVTTPTLYAYFDSKNDIYDAMFGQAAAEFVEVVSAPMSTYDPKQILWERARRFVAFCTADVARYQLLFQRTIPGFEPSADSYSHAVTALEVSRRQLAGIGITDPKHLDIWTALLTGLIDQQISNDPGGDRWERLTEQFVDMYLSYCLSPSTHRTAPAKKGSRK